MLSGRRRLPLVALAAVLGVLAGLAVRTVTTQGHDDTAGAVNTWASWEFHFDSSAEMMATADVVVEGDILDVRRGRILAGDSPVKQQLKEYRIAVSRNWKGSSVASTLTVESAGWMISTIPGEEEAELRLAGTVQPAPGDHGVFYLTRSEENRRLSFVNDQGILLVESGQVADTNRSDALVTTMERLSQTGLRQQLRRDLRLVQAGAVSSKRSG